MKNSLPRYISGSSYSLVKQKEALEGVNKRLRRVKNQPCGERAPKNAESAEGAPNGGEHQQEAPNASPKTPASPRDTLKRRYRKRGQAELAKAVEQQEHRSETFTTTPTRCITQPAQDSFTPDAAEIIKRALNNKI